MTSCIISSIWLTSITLKVESLVLSPMRMDMLILIWEVVAYIVKEAKKDEMGEYDPEEVLFVVQGEMEYGNSLGQVD